MTDNLRVRVTRRLVGISCAAALLAPASALAASTAGPVDRSAPVGVSFPTIEAPSALFPSARPDERDLDPALIVRRNGAGSVWLLDPAGEATCSAAEDLASIVESGGDTGIAVSEVIRVGRTSLVAPLVATADALARTLDIADVVRVLHVCADHGYEL